MTSSRCSLETTPTMAQENPGHDSGRVQKVANSAPYGYMSSVAVACLSTRRAIRQQPPLSLRMRSPPRTPLRTTRELSKPRANVSEELVPKEKDPGENESRRALSIVHASVYLNDSYHLPPTASSRRPGSQEQITMELLSYLQTIMEYAACQVSQVTQV